MWLAESQNAFSPTASLDLQSEFPDLDPYPTTTTALSDSRLTPRLVLPTRSPERSMPPPPLPYPVNTSNGQLWRLPNGYARRPQTSSSDPFVDNRSTLQTNAPDTVMTDGTPKHSPVKGQTMKTFDGQRRSMTTSYIPQVESQFDDVMRMMDSPKGDQSDKTIPSDMKSSSGNRISPTKSTPALVDLQAAWQSQKQATRFASANTDLELPQRDAKSYKVTDYMLHFRSNGEKNSPRSRLDVHAPCFVTANEAKDLKENSAEPAEGSKRARCQSSAPSTRSTRSMKEKTTPAPAPGPACAAKRTTSGTKRKRESGVTITKPGDATDGASSPWRGR